MNVYLIGVGISLIVYIVIGNYVGTRVKTLDDYYVMGRNAPTVLIVGTLVASFLSTNAFMGDTGYAYSGYAMLLLILIFINAVGYVIGAMYFGRYIRRAKPLTVPHYFGERFKSKKVQMVAGITTVVGVTGYLLSVTQGTSLLMSELTGLPYQSVLLACWIVYTSFCFYSGSGGVVLTDTIMFFVFVAAAIVATPSILQAAGGWFPGLEQLANFDLKPDILSYHGMVGANADYATPRDAIAWAVTMGVVWALVVASSPWQVGRFLMAKSEHVVIRSAIIAPIVAIFMCGMTYFVAPYINLVNPDIVPNERNYIWAAMNLMPTFWGVLLLTGIMAAGLSSASTFLSLIGFSMTNDVLQIKNDDEKKKLRISRITMVCCGLVALAIAYFQPPAMLYITFFAATIFASSWGPIAFMSVWSKKITKTGAFWGIICGFVGNAAAKLLTMKGIISLPWYMDPFVVGLICCLAAVYIGSTLTKVTDEEKAYRENLFIVPESECDPVEIKKTLGYSKLLVAGGLVAIVLMVFLYAIPYAKAVGM
ncbi:MAG: sodium:solute symporter family protein [Desulfitobacteriaceae bacterium]|nr:sodium:solute symporter family protein [Desulfitobacteriaceae bacterium]MDD4752702.1 sodium:solute symporter family protein [Desulfitobacteriaceae bacterium]